MIFNEERTKIYCQECNEWLSIDPCEYLLIGDSVQCMNFHHLGYVWDIFCCEFYYLYHNQGQCRCVQAETKCSGKEENCENILGRLCFRQDKEETE